MTTTILILIIIGLVVAVNVLLTTLIITKWKITAFKMMHDITETREELHSIVQEFSEALAFFSKANAAAEQNQEKQPAATRKGKPQEDKEKQPIGFKISAREN